MLLAWSSPALLEHVFEAGLPEFSAQSITSSVVLQEEVAEVQRSGYAVNNAEMFSGMYCVAVPVMVSGTVLGALAVSRPSQMVPPGGLPPLVQRLKTEATTMAGLHQRVTRPGLLVCESFQAPPHLQESQAT